MKDFEIEDENLVDDEEGDDDEIILSKLPDPVFRLGGVRHHTRMGVRRLGCVPGIPYEECKYKLIDGELVYVCETITPKICN